MTIHHALEHLRFADCELVALATHVLDQDGQVKLAAAGDTEDVGVGGLFHAQRDVALQFAHQAIANLAAGHELAFASRERGGVDLEGHRERRFIDFDRRQALRILGIAEREADVDLLDAGDGDDVAGRS